MFDVMKNLADSFVSVGVVGAYVETELPRHPHWVRLIWIAQHVIGGKLGEQVARLEAQPGVLKLAVQLVKGGTDMSDLPRAIPGRHHSQHLGRPAGACSCAQARNQPIRDRSTDQRCHPRLPSTW